MLRSRIAFAVIAATLSVPGVALAENTAGPEAKNGCEGAAERQRIDRPVLSEYRIVSVTPYTKDRTPIKTTWKELRGAVVRVEAEPGLTAEWLQLRFQRRLAVLQSSSQIADGGPLTVPGVWTSVAPAPDGFFVAIVAPDKGGGAEVLRRAEELRTAQNLRTAQR